ncbi:MAG: response regulator [Lachnospiraceae bacterium]|nr:response regulator [Lachnospiraceae bacterium]
MKYKLLLTGRNNTVIDDMFAILDDKIEPVSTSMRWEDMSSHLKYFEPDAFCFCIANETTTSINSMVSFKQKLDKMEIPLVVIGPEEDCADFERMNPNIADLVLQKPLTASMIEDEIIKYIDQLRLEKKKRLEEERRRKEEEEAARRKAARKHILVVDDSSAMLKTIKDQLKDEYDVATAISGKIAMKFLEKKETDLILLDYEMPEENGPAVLNKLRANDATKDIPVIFLTGIRDKEKIQQVLSMKPQGYLLKPIEHDKLIEALASILNKE